MAKKLRSSNVFLKRWKRIKEKIKLETKISHQLIEKYLYQNCNELELIYQRLLSLLRKAEMN